MVSTTAPPDNALGLNHEMGLCTADGETARGWYAYLLLPSLMLMLVLGLLLFQPKIANVTHTGGDHS